MITNKGEELLARFLAGAGGSWAGALEFGVGETAVAKTDESLDFPFIRVPIDQTDYFLNTTTGKWNIRFRGSLKPGDSGVLYEVGVFSSEEFPEQEAGNILLLDYSQLDTVYSTLNASVVSNGRVGSLSTLVSVPSGQTGYVRGFKPGLDLGLYSGNDTVNLAYDFTQTAGVPNISIRFESTETDYFQHTFTPTTGYNIEVASRSVFTTTGNPSWTTANAVYVEIGAQGDVLLDGIMIEDTINIPTYGMAIRRVLVEPIVKSETSEVEVSFDVELDI